MSSSNPQPIDSLSRLSQRRGKRPHNTKDRASNARAVVLRTPDNITEMTRDRLLSNQDHYPAHELSRAVLLQMLDNPPEVIRDKLLTNQDHHPTYELLRAVQTISKQR